MRHIIIALLLAASVACTSTTTVTKHIGPNAPRGTFIFTLTADNEVRQMFEDRLVADMQERGLTAFASYADLPDALGASRDSVLAAAKARNALFILAVEEVPEGAEGRVAGEGRITRAHPTLQDFFNKNPPPEQEYAAKSAVWVEVSAFQIRETQAVLVWSGAAWSFQADGQGGAIPGISATIADAIATERQRYIERYGSAPDGP